MKLRRDLPLKYSPWEAVHLQKRHSVSICHRIINRLFFGIMDPQALKEWVEGDFALDLTTADLLPEFKALADDLDPGLRLTMDGQDSYGIPYNVEGYGYIVDKEMIALHW